jgi:hypothetical protein
MTFYKHVTRELTTVRAAVSGGVMRLIDLLRWAAARSARRPRISSNLSGLYPESRR